jgi:hypothetical protein
MKCTSCGEYIYKGRNLTPAKEITNEKYLSIPIFRFYIPLHPSLRRDHLQTDPKNVDYAYGKGAKRNFEPWQDQSRMEEVNGTTGRRLHRLEVEGAQEEETELWERNAMAQLEEKMMDGTKSGYEMNRWKMAGVVEWKRKLSPLSKRPPWSSDQKQTERMTKSRKRL